MRTQENVAVVDGLLRLDGADLALLGSVCVGCGTHYFPRALGCRNPGCDQKELDDVELGRTGELYSWTVQHYRPPALFRIADWQPCAVGLVEVPEGLRILAMLTGAPAGQIAIGTPMVLTALELYAEDGRSVVTYAYAPDTGGTT